MWHGVLTILGYSPTRTKLTQVAVSTVGGAIVARAVVGVSSVEVTVVGSARVGNAIVCCSRVVGSLHPKGFCMTWLRSKAGGGISLVNDYPGQKSTRRIERKTFLTLCADPRT